MHKNDTHDRETFIDVSVCIVNWNTNVLTAQLIQSIYDTAKQLTIEIILVDNASIDGTVLHISKLFPEVKIIANSSNVGYGPAMNQALRIANGKYRMILNSDVVLLENALSKMVHFLDTNEDAGAVGPICMDVDGNIGYSYGYFPKPGLMILERIFGSFTPRALRPPPLEVKPCENTLENIQIEYIKGACMLVRREICEKTGVFDERFFAYFEETDWCKRMNQNGVKRYLVCDAKIIHIYDASFSKIPAKGFAYFIASRQMYLEKHHGKIISRLFGYFDAFANARHKLKLRLLQHK